MSDLACADEPIRSGDANEMPIEELNHRMATLEAEVSKIRDRIHTLSNAINPLAVHMAELSAHLSAQDNTLSRIDGNLNSAGGLIESVRELSAEKKQRAKSDERREKLMWAILLAALPTLVAGCLGGIVWLIRNAH